MFEREFSAVVSEDKILQVMSSLSLSPTVQRMTASNMVATCILEDDAGSTVAEGAGKGKYCQTGALAESLEHYALEHHSARDLVPCSLKQIRHQALTRLDGLLANLPESQSCIDCVEMTDIQTGRTAWVPAILQLPTKRFVEKNTLQTETSFLNRYSTNSGIAFGCSESEAVLHGLNEILERHMYSKVLMSLCGQHEPIALRSPSAAIIDEIFSDQLEFQKNAKTMKIVIAETIHGVYFGMAIPKRPDGRHIVCPVGSGCSLDPHVAIERAATELLQTMELYDESEKTNDLCAVTLIERSSTLRPLLHLEVLRNIEHTCKRLEPARKLSVAEQVEFIIEKLSATGFRPFQRTLSSFTNGCAVTQIYVPGMERFNLIRAGLPVVPQHLLHANRCLF